VNGVYSRSGEGLVESDGESIMHMQKVGERWGGRRTLGKKTVHSLFDVGTEKINRTRIRARFPIGVQLAAETVPAAKGSLTVGG